MRLTDGRWLVKVLADIEAALDKNDAWIDNMEDMNVVHASDRVAKRHNGRKVPAGLIGRRQPIDGVALREFLEKKHQTISWLARKIGVTDGAIHGWMKGKEQGCSDPTEEMLHRMASALRVPPEQLIVQK